MDVMEIDIYLYLKKVLVVDNRRCHQNKAGKQMNDCLDSWKVEVDE